MTILISLAVLPLVAVGVVWIVRNPFAGFALYAAIIPFGSGIEVPIALPDPFDTMSTLLGMIVSGAMLLRLVIDRRHRAEIRPVVWIWVMFFAVNALTMAWSVDPSATRPQILLLGSLVLQYVVVAAYRPTQERMRMLARAIEVGGALTGAFAVLLLFTGNLPPSGIGIPRFATGAGGGDPNITAASLLLPLSIAMGRYLDPRGALGRRWAFTNVLLMLSAIMLTVSRGGILSALVVVGAWILIKRTKRSMVVPGLLLLLVVAAVPLGITERFTNTSSTGRTDIWQIALTACSDYCPAGSGPGTFPTVHETQLLTDPSLTSSQLRFEAHNIWIGAAIETGVVGLVLMAIGMALSIASAARAGPNHRDVLVAFAGVLTANMFLSNLEFKYVWLLLSYAALSRTASTSHGTAENTTRPEATLARPTGSPA